MKDSFARLHPAVLLIYFAVQAVLTAICFHPVLLGISLCCGLVFTAVCIGKRKGIMWLGITFVYMVTFGMINPLINHQGITVLFLFLGREITLQSFCYGLLTGAMVSAMCLWLYLMGKTIDSKKAAYIFGRGMPVITLMIFMSVRFVRRYQKKCEEIFEARKGMYYEESRFKSIMETAAALLTFGVENGVDTADSMTARGYGCHKPTGYYDYKFTFKDCVSAVTLLAAVLVIIFGIAKGSCKMYFFPEFFTESNNPFVFAAYFVLCAYPLFLYIWSEIKWTLLK